MADTDNNGNGRITLALAVQKIDNLTEIVRAGNARMLECYNENRANIVAATERVNALERRADVNDEQHKQMKQDSTVTTVIGSVTAAIAGIASSVISALQGR